MRPRFQRAKELYAECVVSACEGRQLERVVEYKVTTVAFFFF